jgi:hypothetical protein
MGRCCWPGALFDPSPEGFCDVVDIHNERLVVINGMDVDADLIMEVQRTSLVRPLRDNCSLRCARRWELVHPCTSESNGSRAASCTSCSSWWPRRGAGVIRGC